MTTSNEVSAELLSHFRPPAFPGSYFLSIEGIEGAGKSTQIIKIKEYLESKDFRVLILREPGGTPFGEKLRQAVLSSQTKLHPIAEAHLFASARAQLFQEVTLIELETPGTIILYDRYIDSTIAYQGMGRNLGSKTVLEMHKKFPLNLVPHQTFYLKIDLETSMQRQKMRNAPKDYFEAQGDDFYNKLIEGYAEAEKLFPNRIVTINATRSAETVFSEICEHLDSLIAQKPTIQ